MSEIKIASKEINLVDIKKLKPREGNRNLHDDSQIDMLAKHFKETGFRNPIIVSNQSGEIVCGTGRYLAAVRCGMTELPVIFQDYETPDLEYAHHVADNALGLWSELDLAGINIDLGSIGPIDIEMLGIKDFVLDPSELNNSSTELDLNDFSNFEHKCPKCGFEWSGKSNADAAAPD